MSRALNLLLAVCLAVVLCAPVAFIALLSIFLTPGSVFYRSQRVGRDNVLFTMIKFRTMRPDTPALATHLLADPQRYLTAFGAFLRTYSLDELPQLFNVIRGEMALVGPRPALFNQHDLIALRTAKGIHRLTPGLTGWAQVNGRDDLPIPVKVAFDEEYAKNACAAFDLRILLITVLRVAAKKGVRH